MCRYVVFLMLLLLSLNCYAGSPAEKQAQEALRFLKQNPHLKTAEKEAAQLAPVIEKALRQGQKYCSEKKSTPAYTENALSSNCKKKYVLFVSSSIPTSTLRAYTLSAVKLKREKAICVAFALRGFVDGAGKLTPTIRWYLSFALEDEHKPVSKSNIPLVHISVDPDAAARAGATRVPALWDPSEKCLVYGDASLDYMLQALKEKRCSESVGSTYAFAEEDARDQIRQKLASMDFKVFQKKQTEKVTREMTDRYTHFACPGIGHATETRTYSVIPIYRLPFDIPDPRNPDSPLYPAGYSFNVLEYAPFDGSFLIVDAADKEQLKQLPALIKQAPRPVRVLLAGGNYTDMAREYSDRPDVQVYASCNTIYKLLELYNICTGGTPCIVWAEGNRFLIREIGIR